MRLLLFNLATDAEDPILAFTSHWIRTLASSVEFIHVVTMRAGNVDLPNNVRVYSVGKEKAFSEPRRVLEFYRILMNIVRHNRIDICFSHMMPIFTILAAPVLKPKGIPIVTWYAHPKLSWILKLAHHASDRMVASVAAAYPYIPDKLTVVGQGIDTNLFAPNGIPSSAEPRMILSAGRISPVKDHITLIEACRRLRLRWRSPFEAVVLGGPATPRDTSYANWLREEVAKRELDQFVRFEPPVCIAALPAWYSRCTVHVNMTPTGSGDKAALESMSCARPCLVANEGFRETLGEYADELIYRYADPDDLADKLLNVLEASSSIRERMGAYLRQRVIGSHGLERLGGALLEVFHTTMRRAASSTTESNGRNDGR